jgi:hypothetical protein
VALRPTSALLLAVPLALLAAGALRLHGVRRAGPRLAVASATAVLGPALVCALLLRSGLSPWQWTAYELWVPRWYVSERVFALRHALQDNLEFPLASDGEPQSNLELGLRVLLGLPGVGPGGSLGPLWPLLGWLAALPLWRAGRRAGGGARRAMPWAAAAGAAWLLGHVVLFSLYFYPAARFYLGAAALCPLLLGSALGRLAAAPARAPRHAGALVAALLVAVQAVAVVPFARLLSVPPRSRPPLEQAVPRRVAAWVRMDDAERRRGRVVFDPVYAQALGLLPPEAVDRVGAWGRLPRTFHVHRLMRMERIARSDVVRRRPPAPGAPRERRAPR